MTDDGGVKVSFEFLVLSFELEAFRFSIDYFD